jgi:hypothetical protein
MSGYIGATPVPQSIQTKQTFTATASQTTFGTTGYSDGTLVDVHLNGVLLVGGGVDYTATNGSDIVLTTGASAGDTLEFSTFSALQLSDQVFNNSITLQNPTEEDTDGGRESTLIFKGEQSGGEKTTLAEIEASHDGTADDQKGDLIFRTNDGSDGSAPTEAVRIDSAQNLLVGKTDTGVTTSGTIVQSNGSTWKIRDGNAPLFLKRLTSDGDIAAFYKDGTKVGSIGNSGTALVFENPNANSYFAFHANNQSNGIFYQDGTSKVFGPYVARDDEIDLGASNARWKDLYLSGGVYLGGTGAANKLDDYEEGTWTPTLTNITGGSLVAANYVKVGRLVTAFITFTCTSAPTANSSRFSLPFTPDGPNIFGHGTWSRGTVEGGVLEVQSSNAVCYFAESGSSSGTYSGTATYQTA